MKKIGLGLLYATPFLVFAAQGTTLGEVLFIIGNLFNQLVPILIILAIIYFIWGVLQFITKQDDPEGREKARGIMIYGIIALFVIVSVWGLIAVVQNTFRIDSDPRAQVPDTPGQQYYGGSGGRYGGASRSGNKFFDVANDSLDLFGRLKNTFLPSSGSSGGSDSGFFRPGQNIGPGTPQQPQVIELEQKGPPIPPLKDEAVRERLQKAVDDFN